MNDLRLNQPSGILSEIFRLGKEGINVDSAVMRRIAKDHWVVELFEGLTMVAYILEPIETVEMLRIVLGLRQGEIPVSFAHSEN
jgi:hypothetical protein